MKKLSEDDSLYLLTGIPFSEGDSFCNEKDLENYRKEDNELYGIDLSNVLKNFHENRNINKENIDQFYWKSAKDKDKSLEIKESDHPVILLSTDLGNKDPEVNNDINTYCPNKQILYSRAANNLKVFLDKKKVSKNMGFISHFNNFHCKFNEKCDKITQTICNKNLNDQLKHIICDKSNQTKRIIMKGKSISTKLSILTTKIPQQKFFSNKSINFQIREKQTPKLKLNDSIIISKPYNFNYSIPTISKKTLKPITFAAVSNKVENEEYFLPYQSDASCGNESKFDEITYISTSKLNSYRNSKDTSNYDFQNLGNVIKKKHSEQLNPKANKSDVSFWDNLPLKSALGNIRISSISKNVLPEKNQMKKDDNCKKINNDNKVIVRNESIITSQGDMINEKYKEVKSKQNKSNFNQRNLSDPTLKNIMKQKFINYHYGDKRRLNEISSSDSKVIRSFYLNQYDELVKSYLNCKDRRIKSVSAKNECSIRLEGPLNPQNDFSTTFLSKSKAIYKCIICSNNTDNLEKCINYLKESFPNTYLRNCKKILLK